jgi:hypothetical protein
MYCRRIGSRLALIICFVFWFSGAEGQEPPLDHFKVYEVEEVSVSISVTLMDQFDEENQPREVDLTAINFFANPVEKRIDGEPVAPIQDRNRHLVWYRFSDDAPERTILVENQFTGGETQEWRLANAEWLLVPSEKLEEGNEFPQTLDHYKCYQVLEAPAPGVIVELEDQFDERLGMAETVTVEEPCYFCNPVSKNGDSIMSPEEHLAFYDIGMVDDIFCLNEPVGYSNQFVDEAALTVGCPVKLGVPSTKTLPCDPDMTPPTVTCPGDITVCATPAGAAVSFTATATDMCDPSPTVTCNPPSGSTFLPGMTPVTCTATDASGNNAVCSFTVTVTVGGGQIPGDANQDGAINIADAIRILQIKFFSFMAPCMTPASNTQLLDWNGDGVCDLTDAIALLTWLFLAGPPHALGTNCLCIPDCPQVCTP